MRWQRFYLFQNRDPNTSSLRPTRIFRSQPHLTAYVSGFMANAESGADPDNGQYMAHFFILPAGVDLKKILSGPSSHRSLSTAVYWFFKLEYLFSSNQNFPVSTPLAHISHLPIVEPRSSLLGHGDGFLKR